MIIHYRILRCLLVAACFLLGSSWCVMLYAQDTDNESVSASTTQQDVVRRIRFTGNTYIKDRVLENLVRTQTNREFLGIPRFTPWYFVWNLSDGRFGEQPAYLDREKVSNDMERIALYYESLGFLNVSVDTTIVEFRDNRTEVSFIIREGTPSDILTLSYSGFPDLRDPGLEKRFFVQSPLTGFALNDSTFQVNKQYSTQALKNEQNRILTFLKNNGFASADRDSVIAFIRPDSANPANYHVLYDVNPGDIYKFGDLEIRLADTDKPDSYNQKEVLTGPPFTADSSKIILLKEPATDTNFSLLRNQILFKPGEVYNEELYLNTVKEFQNLGMLYIRRFGQSQNGVRPDFSKEAIPAYFDMQTLTKHSISSEFFGMQRFGFGTGFGVDYSNNNVFGNAERLQFSANASFEFVGSRTLEEITVGDTLQSSLFQSFELRGDYSLPRIAFPFAFLDNTRYFTSGLTRYTLAYSRSDQLFFDINSDIRFNLRFEVAHNNRYSSYLDLLEMDLVDTSPTDAFVQNLIDDFGEGSLEFNRILQDFEPQVSSIIRYTFRSQNTDLIKRNFGYYSEYSISSGGNIPWAIDRFMVTPGVLEGNLPALLKLSDNTLVYSRFVKATADYRRYIPISTSSVFAWRFFAGLAHPYGKNGFIPLNRRFFAGGSNDIRGWAPFQLGPGSIPSNEVTINGGEIKLAAFTETRQIFLRNFLSADWHAAWFVDAGNIWYGPRNNFQNQANEDELEQGRFRFSSFYKQIAVGSGLGVRLDWQYVVIRFDLAFRVHDLSVGWFNNRKAYFSFGIGHSF